MRDFSKTKVVYKSVPLQTAVFLLATDASWANGHDLRSQAAYVVMLADHQLEQEKWSHISPLRWKSYKLDRHVQSTLGSELMALARGIAECDWMRSLLAEAIFPEYSLEHDVKFRERFRAVITVDNEPIYDHTQGDGIVVKDKRLAIDMLLVRRDIRRNSMCLRWVDTRQMIADALTKSSADLGFLRFVLKYAECMLVAEHRSLDWRLKEREERKAARGSRRSSVLASVCVKYHRVCVKWQRGSDLSDGKGVLE